MDSRPIAEKKGDNWISLLWACLWKYHERTMKQNGGFTIGGVTVREYLWNLVMNRKEHVISMETIKCICEIQFHKHTARRKSIKIAACWVYGRLASPRCAYTQLVWLEICFKQLPPKELAHLDASRLRETQLLLAECLQSFCSEPKGNHQNRLGLHLNNE